MGGNHCKQLFSQQLLIYRPHRPEIFRAALFNKTQRVTWEANHNDSIHVPRITSRSSAQCISLESSFHLQTVRKNKVIFPHYDPGQASPSNGEASRCSVFRYKEILLHAFVYCEIITVYFKSWNTEALTGCSDAGDGVSSR